MKVVTYEEWMEQNERLVKQQVALTKAKDSIGKDAYNIAVKEGFEGTEAEWLESIKGESAYQIAKRLGLTEAETEEEWINSLGGGGESGVGPEGKSAYEVYVEITSDDPVKTEQEWLESLEGKTAYEYAVEEGFEGDEEEFAEALVDVGNKEDKSNKITAWGTPTDVQYPSALLVKMGINDLDGRVQHLEETGGPPGPQGDDGKTAYEYAVEEGFEGDEEEFGELLASLGDLPDFDNVEVTTNKITSWGSPTDTQYPSAKLTKTELDKKEVSSNKITRLYEGVTDTQYASAKAVWDEFQIVKKATILESWDMFSEVTKDGRASDFVAPGDRLIGYWEVDGIYQPIPWEVLGIDQDEAVDGGVEHTVTLGSVDCLFSAMFDNAETGNPDTDRASYGNNNWELSNIRQYLNSGDAPFVHTPTHEWDSAPTGYPTNGFLARLHPTMRDVIVPVKKWTSLANIDVEGGVSDVQLDETIFLLSQVEINGGTSSVGTVTNEFIYQRYVGAGNADRIKYGGAIARGWWTRSPHVSSSNSVRYVYSGGSMGDSLAYISISNNRVAPACVIG